MVRKLFLAHPNTVGESYTEHMAAASRFGARMVGAGLACLVHAVLPMLFVRAGSDCVARLHEEMARRGADASPSRGRNIVGTAAEQRPVSTGPAT